MKKVVAVMMTVLIIFAVNVAFSHSGSMVGLNSVKQFGALNSLKAMINIPSAPRPATDLGSDMGNNPPGPRPTAGIAADMGNNPPGPRPTAAIAADMGNNPPGPRPSGDLADGGSLPSKGSTSAVRFVSTVGALPLAPRPSM